MVFIVSDRRQCFPAGPHAGGDIVTFGEYRLLLMATPPFPQDRVLLSTRVLAGVIIGFLVLAFAVLYPWPTDTRRLFAWEIRPTMSAMVLGSVYLGGAYFFLRVTRATRWHTVAGGFVPVGTFASLMGLTTILHWDRFLHGNLAFWLWVALYFTTPFLVFAVFLANQRHYSPGTADDVLLPPVAAGAIVIAGGVSVVMSAFLYLLPHRAISIWPWQLTPLTARMLGAIFALGLAGLGAARERRWSAARLLIQVACLMLLLILLAGVRAHREFDSSNALTWLFAVGFATTTAATVALYLRMESRVRASAASG
ncbi:hypothetical protein [Jatrophihabitans sp.]|uniref:hypothetical protein n=1 Tax=Jatrophihabitans sp. TaxID=1932789 RepID=UPI0038CDBC98